MTLEHWLSTELYRLLLVFCRVSAAFMLLPGLGEGQLPARVRIMAGLAVAYCIAPLAGPATAAPGLWGSVAAAALEVMTGAFLGTLSRILLAAVQTAGQIIGQSIGISNAFAFGIGMDNSAVLGAAIYVACLVALFAIDGHHLGLRALADSYALVGLGQPLPTAAAARSVTEGVEVAFHLSMQLSMPFLILSVLFNVALAGINRALPAMPVFMIGAPALLLVGLHLLQVTAPSFVAEVLAAYGPALLAGR